MLTSAHQEETSKTLEHYRLVTVLAELDASCPPERLDVGNGGNRINLSSVAKKMHVQVAIATYPGANGMQTYAAHGFNNATSVGPFAAACNKLCSERALVIPDIAFNAKLSGFVDLLPKTDIRFLVGIALTNGQGQRVGSLAVMNSSTAVASQGISFRNLTAFAKAFAGTGRLHAELIAA